VGEKVESFPLFPLGIVLLPGEVVPLHIFEERYKLMIGECLDGDTEFGIVWLADDGLREVGCTARVTQVLDRFDDGRMNILVTGGQPFGLMRRIDSLPYPAGDIELIEAEESEVAGELVTEARERYADLVERVTDERPDSGTLAELDAFGMAATIEFEPKAKQELLESRSEADRLRKVAELFRKTVKRLDESERSAEIAKTNGHPRR
jgi:Lon protease-like protein